MKLYKYTTAKNGLDVIENNSIVITKPIDFNDPYDFNPYWDEEDLDKACDFAANCIFELDIYKGLKNNAEKKGQLAEKKILQILLKEYKEVKEFVRLNPAKYKPIITTEKAFNLMLKNLKGKKFAEKIALKKKFDDIVFQKKNELKEIFNNLQNIRDKIYIGCLSEQCDGTNMWAHYADGHKGICIEFDIPNEEVNNFWQIIYSERSNYQLYNLTREFFGRQIAFEEMTTEEQILQMQKRLFNPWLIKEDKWAEEKEWRVMFSEENILKYPKKFLKVNKNNKELILYRMPQISKVILGNKCLKDEQSKIIDICNEGHIALSKVELDNKSYKLHINKFVNYECH